MPINNDDIEQGNSPITPPTGDIEGRELYNPVPMPEVPEPAPEPVPEPAPEQSGSKWNWVGSPDRPEAKEHSDGISDLFTVTDDDVDAGEGVDELVSVDIERDVIDSDEDGSLDDLTSVTNEDIMGSEDYGQSPLDAPSQQYRLAPKRTSSSRRADRYTPPSSARGMRE